MTCCDEHNCRRKTPIDLVLAELSGRVFAVTAKRVVRNHGNGRATFAATARHDITGQFRAFLVQNWESIALIFADENERPRYTIHPDNGTKAGEANTLSEIMDLATEYLNSKHPKSVTIQEWDRDYQPMRGWVITIGAPAIIGAKHAPIEGYFERH